MTDLANMQRIAVLGASGLIGEAVARDLMHAGFAVVPVARRFTGAQTNSFAQAIKARLVDLSATQLKALVASADIVVNCVGVLQDGGRGNTGEVHENFVRRVLLACGTDRLLIHLSIPEGATPDDTAFSQTKRRGEEIVRANGTPYVILRPGFVIGEAAYGGSALIRALASWPIALPPPYADVPFAATDIHDIGRTITTVATAWASGKRDWAETWDILEPTPSTVGEVVAAFRSRLGLRGRVWTTPVWLLKVGTLAGDAVALLGWSPPIRTTAIVELSRGVQGNAAPVSGVTGIPLPSLAEILRAHPATVQEKWFSRLYLLKPMVLVSLALFWMISGLIALFVSFDAATLILRLHGVPQQAAWLVTLISSFIDIAVGLLIASRSTAPLGLWAGVTVSIGYMAGAVLLTPELWADPLGALIKTGPAIVLMAVALAILEER